MGPSQAKDAAKWLGFRVCPICQNVGILQPLTPLTSPPTEAAAAAEEAQVVKAGNLLAARVTQAKQFLEPLLEEKLPKYARTRGLKLILNENSPKYKPGWHVIHGKYKVGTNKAKPVTSNSSNKLPSGAVRYDCGVDGVDGWFETKLLAQKHLLRVRLWMELGFPRMEDVEARLSPEQLLLLRAQPSTPAEVAAAADGYTLAAVTAAAAAVAAKAAAAAAVAAGGSGDGIACGGGTGGERSNGVNAYEVVQARQSRAAALRGDVHWQIKRTSPSKKLRYSVVTTEGGTRLDETDYGGEQPYTTSVLNLQEQAKLTAHEVADRLNAESNLHAQLKLAREEGAAAGKAAEVMLAAILSGETKLDMQQLARQLLSEEKFACAQRIRGGDFGGIGSNSALTKDMTPRTQQDLVRFSGLMMEGLLSKVKGGEPDVPGVLSLLMTQRNELSAQLRDAAQGVSGMYGVSSLNHPVCVQIKNSIAICKQLGMRRVARQLMSIVTACMSEMGLTSRLLQEYFSAFVQLEVGENVKVTAGRHNKRRRCAVVVEANDEVDGMVRVCLEGDPLTHGANDHDGGGDDDGEGKP